MIDGGISWPFRRLSWSLPDEQASVKGVIPASLQGAGGTHAAW